MQAPRILTQQQRHALETICTFFKGVTPFLESIEDKLQPDERLVAGNLRDLAGVCERHLADGFPELLEWEQGGAL